MLLLLILFGLLSVSELLICSHELWAVHRPIAAGLTVTLALVSGGLFGLQPSIAWAIVAILSMYRVVNLLRLVQDRSEAHYLRSTALRTSLLLISAQLLTMGCLAIDQSIHLSELTMWWALAVVQIVVAAGLFVSTRRQLQKLTLAKPEQHYSDSQLPSLSVCIPARNETQALEECLKSLVGSDYPKLEILVLDDCSQGSRTSDIIRSYAHQGVRFIQGTPAEDKWLAKNWAYQQLFAASSGAAVLFCGVDVRFEPQSLRQIVATLESKQKRMVSILPHNIVPKRFRGYRSLLIQPARYAWEVCLPRRRFKRPPVLSSCWVAERKLISSAGGFAAIRGSVSPEAHFARRAITSDVYSFVAADGDVAVTSYKTAADQWDTAVRTRYPQLHKRIELVAAVTAAELLLLAGPLVLGVGAFLAGKSLLGLVAILAFAVQSAIYGQVVNLTYRRRILSGLLLMLPAVLLDIYTRHESMWRYEFGEVTWKGRNVCLPVMRVIPRLPSV